MVVVVRFHHVECLRFIGIAKSDPSCSQLEELTGFLLICSFSFRCLSKTTIQTLNELEDIIQTLCLSKDIVYFYSFLHMYSQFQFWMNLSCVLPQQRCIYSQRNKFYEVFLSSRRLSKLQINRSYFRWYLCSHQRSSGNYWFVFGDQINLVRIRWSWLNNSIHSFLTDSRNAFNSSHLNNSNSF